MYLSSIRTGLPTGTGRVPLRRVLAGNVLALGTVSLLTDVSTEMVTAILPAYVVFGLHLTMIQYGAVDGVYVGATALTRLLGGYVADRFRARKPVAALGYGLGVAAKIGLFFAGGAAAVGGSLVADRIGKGLRTAPRDALITLSVDEPVLARAFGVHRAMDAFGAFLGPLTAILVLGLAARQYDALFVVSFCIALLGLITLFLFVQDRQQPASRTAASVREALGLLRRPEIRRIQYAAALLGLVTIGDGFVYLLLQQWQQLPAVWFPLYAVIHNVGFLLLAPVFGMLADRFGRRRTVIAGHLALVAVYLLLVTLDGGWPATVLTLLLYGVFYAATDGVLMAAAGPLLPDHLRTTGLAMLQTGQALGYLVSSILFGAAWSAWGAHGAGWVFAGAACVALPLAAWWLRIPGKPAEVEAAGEAAHGPVATAERTVAERVQATSAETKAAETKSPVSERTVAERTVAERTTAERTVAE